MSSLAVWSVGGLYYAFNVVYRKSHNSYHFPGILSHYFSKWNEFSSLLCIIIAFVCEITTILFMEGCENHMGFRYNSCWHGIHPNPYMHFHWWSAWSTENDVALAFSAQNFITISTLKNEWKFQAKLICMQWKWTELFIDLRTVQHLCQYILSRVSSKDDKTF